MYNKTRRCFSSSNNDCNYVLVGGLALVLACLVATHLDGMRYETSFNQELREESQRKSWNEIVNQHWS